MRTNLTVGPSCGLLVCTALVTATCTPDHVGDRGLIEDLPLREASREIELGAFDDSVLAFSRIGDVAEGPAGNVYVLQPLDGQIISLTREGRLVRRIGGRGEGPGRLVSPGGLGWLGDTLWVVDVGARRVSFFLNGTFVRSDTYGREPTPDGHYVTVQIPLEDGTYAGIVAPDEAGGGPPPALPILRTDPGGRWLEDLARLRYEHPTRIRLGTTRTTTLYHDMPLFEVSRRGDRVVVVDRPLPKGSESTLRATAITAGGDTIFSRQLQGRAVPLSDDMWEARIDERRAALPNSRINLEDYLETVLRPAALPPATRLAVAADGGVWIGRELLETRDLREWIALERDGTPRFRVELPKTFRVQDVVEDRIWGVIHDSLGIPYVRMYRVQ